MRFRRARFVDLHDSGPSLIRLRHAMTGASALVSEDTAQLWLALPNDTFLDVAALRPRLAPALREGCTEEELGACLEALAAAGLVETPERRIVLGYDAVADLYDARPPPDPALFTILRAHTGPGQWQDVLDVGTGTGHALPQLAACGAQRLFGVDLSANMLEHARARCAREGIAIELQQARAEELPFADDALSLLVTSSALWWFDSARFWSEAARVLRPEGRIVVLTTVPDEPFYELLARCQIRPRPPCDWDVATIVHDLPATVGLVHFATIRGTMELSDQAQLLALARSLSPPGSDDVIYAGLETCDLSGVSWPLTLPTVSAIGVLRLFEIPAGSAQAKASHR